MTYSYQTGAQSEGAEKAYTSSEVKELLTGLLKELEAKADTITVSYKKEKSWQNVGISTTNKFVAFPDIRTLFNKLLQ